MNISSDHRLAEIVDLVPGAPRVLQSFDLDYCCGGGRSLVDACELAGIDVSEVIEALDGLDTGPAPDWVPMSPALLAVHVRPFGSPASGEFDSSSSS